MQKIESYNRKQFCLHVYGLFTIVYLFVYMFTKRVQLYTKMFTSIQLRMHGYLSTCIRNCNYCLRKVYTMC